MLKLILIVSPETGEYTLGETTVTEHELSNVQVLPNADAMLHEVHQRVLAVVPSDEATGDPD